MDPEWHRRTTEQSWSPNVWNLAKLRYIWGFTGLQNSVLPHWKNCKMSRGNRPGGTCPDLNLRKREGILAEATNLIMSCGGYDINMDGTKYSLVHDGSDTGHGQSKLNFSMIAMRLSNVSWWSIKGPQTCCRSDSSSMPVVSSLFHRSLTSFFSWT